MNNSINKSVNEKEEGNEKTFVNQISSSFVDEMISDNSKIENYIKTLNSSPYFWKYDLNEQLQLLSLGISESRTYGDWQDNGKQVARKQKSVGKIYTLNNTVKYMFNEDQCYTIKDYDENIKDLFKGIIVYNENEFKNISKTDLIEKLNEIRNYVFNKNKEILEKYISNQTFDYNSIAEEFINKYYSSSEKSNNLSYKEKEKTYIEIYDKAPFSLRVVGINANSRIRISLEAIDHINKHFDGNEKEEIMKTLPSMIANPTLILKGSKKDSLVLLSNININNQNILIPLHYNKENESVDIYNVASIYGKDNVEFYIEKEFVNHNVLAFNTKKIENYREPYDRLLLPKGDVISTYDDSITNSLKSVNKKDNDTLYSFNTDNTLFSPVFSADRDEIKDAISELGWGNSPEDYFKEENSQYIFSNTYTVGANIKSIEKDIISLQNKLIENRTKQINEIKNYYKSIGKYTEFIKIDKNPVNHTTNKMLKGNTINDFGEKIGGAKKDLWKINGISINELKNMNIKEQKKYIVKSNIWIKPDYNELIKEGTPKEVAYFYKTIIDATPVSIKHSENATEDDIKSDNERYINFINRLKNLTYSCKTIEDCKKFKEVFKNEFVEKAYSFAYYLKKEYEDIINNKLIRTIDRWNWKTNGMIKEMKEKGFGEDKDEFNFNKRFTTFELDGVINKIKENNRGSYTLVLSSQQAWFSIMNISKDTYNEIYKYKFLSYDNNNHKFYGANDKEELLKNIKNIYNETKKEGIKTSKCKKKYKYTQIDDIKRLGVEDYLKRDANSNDFLNEFKFKGGEFGNWVNNNERQRNLNFSYNSFKDIAKALNIKDEDVSFNGKLSIAFGSRGSGSALAHYEPMRKVINLTKMKGAGALAHEYGHFLDNIICEAVNGENSKTTFGSEVCTSFGSSFEGKKDLKDAFKNLISCMKEKLANDKEKEEYREKELNIIKNTNLLDHYSNRYSSFDLYKNLENCFNVNYETSLDMFDKIINSCKEIVKNKDKDEKLIRFASNLSLNSSFIKNTLKKYYSLKANPLDNLMIDTNFYKLSKEIDNVYSKSGFGYWSSNCEMFARAFSCYINDTLKNNYNITNNYLTGHCEVVAPTGEEREKINKCFDKLINTIKKYNLLHTDLKNINKMANNIEELNDNQLNESVENTKNSINYYK